MNEPRNDGQPISPWHENAPERLRISLQGAVILESGAPSPPNDYSYDVQLEERAPERCVWCLEFQGHNPADWHRLEVEARPGDNHSLDWHVCLLGPIFGPCWSGTSRPAQQEWMLTANFAGSATIGGVIWSDRIVMEPARDGDLPRRYFLAPDPEEEDLEALVADDGSPTCNPLDAAICRPARPPESKLLCCTPDPTKTCTCDNCPCGTRKVDAIKSPAPNRGHCSGCFGWVCPPPPSQSSLNLLQATDLPSLDNPLAIVSSGSCGCAHGNCSCGGGGGGTGSGPVQGAASGHAQVDLHSGNLSLPLPNVTGGAFDTVPGFVYNSLVNVASSNGHGVAGLFSRTVTEVNATTATVELNSGSRWTFTSKNVNGEYLAPAGTALALKQNADGTWTFTHPDQSEDWFDADGHYAQFRSPAGGRWTISLGTGDRVTKVVQPTGGRTTFAYDASNYLKRVTDPAGRVTTFVMDDAGNLAQRICPELCVSEMRYNASHLMTASIDPEGARTSYSYDGSKRVTVVRQPTGDRTTYSYRATRTAVIDPLGNRTTISFNGSGGISAAIYPNGTRTTLLWAGSALQGFVAPTGGRATQTYRQTAGRANVVESYRLPLSGRFTYLYDASDRMKATIDFAGRRVTNTWDASNNLTGVQKPLGQQVAYRYNSAGQKTATIDALGNRVTRIFNSLGQQSGEINALGQRSTYTYNAASQMTSFRAPLGQRET
ncbi:MAG: hypothetical protein KF861_03550, partial [Planctomycetaceae bacterium]|nr:hypothetical protein [Planctomycetaceae bacterium]